MPRVALYARYSSDAQSASSISDQFRLCREHADRESWTVAGTYHDAAVSRASLTLRPGVQALLQDAQKGTFEIVPAEALDRVSRDQADVATLFKHLQFLGIQLVTLAEGEISELHVGLKGTMNALFLKDLAAKTRRGLRGRVAEGKSGGGLCYGYDVVRDAESDERGARAINPQEAEAVRRVFREFAGGRSPRAIARQLNAEGIPGPGGKLWIDTTVRGHAKRGTGLINNKLYIGKLVWNRLRYVKDPGNRQARLPAQSARGLDRHRRARAAHCRRRALAGRQGPAGRDCDHLREIHRGEARGCRQCAGRGAPAQGAVLRPASLRLLRRALTPCAARTAMRAPATS
jgi:site-specific DNA recombinase